MEPCETLLHWCHKERLNLITGCLSLNLNQRLQCGSKPFSLSERKDSPALLLGQTTKNFVFSFLGFHFGIRHLGTEDLRLCLRFHCVSIELCGRREPKCPIAFVIHEPNVPQPHGHSTRWAQPWIRRGAGREHCSLFYPHSHQFLGSFYSVSLSLASTHGLGNTGEDSLLSAEPYYVLLGLEGCLPLLVSLVREGI